MNEEAYRKKLEVDILAVMEEKLKNGQMDAERARLIARMVLDNLCPPLTLEQIYKASLKLNSEFSELAKAVLPVLEEHDERIRTIVSSHAQNLIKEGKLEEAYSVLKNATSKNN